MIKNIYTDGSTAWKNPSPYGIGWAFVVTNQNDEEIFSDSGNVTTENCKGYKASNNLAEMIAAVKALEFAASQAKDNALFPIRLYSDSELTLNRLFKGYSCKLLPKSVVGRAISAIKILNGGYAIGVQIIPVLLAGHPTKRQLSEGFKIKDNRQFPVSKWNVKCDKLCGIEALKLVPGAIIA